MRVIVNKIEETTGIALSYTGTQARAAETWLRERKELKKSNFSKFSFVNISKYLVFDFGKDFMDIE